MYLSALDHVDRNVKYPFSIGMGHCGRGEAEGSTTSLVQYKTAMWLKELEAFFELEGSSNANKGKRRQNDASSLRQTQAK
jgi:hypothetical protein